MEESGNQAHTLTDHVHTYVDTTQTPCGGKETSHRHNTYQTNNTQIGNERQNTKHKETRAKNVAK
jgi:hypothetical protein